MLEVGELYSSTPLPTSSLQLFISESSPSTSKSSRFSSVLGKPHYLSGAYLLPTVSSSTLYALISNIVATIYQDIPSLKSSYKSRSQLRDLVSLFVFQIHTQVHFSVGETIHAMILFLRFAFCHKQFNYKPNISPITPRNLGTVLLISFLLAEKLNRDKHHPNRWWADSFDLSLSVVNLSERMFLHNIDYRVTINLFES